MVSVMLFNMKNGLTLTLVLFINFIAFGQITGQPNPISLCEGGNAIFKVVVSYPKPSFQWQKLISGIWTNIPSTNNDTLFLNTINFALNNSSYRCIVDSNLVFAQTSNPATLTVWQYSSQPSSITSSINPTCKGQPTSLSVSGGFAGSGASWKWYSGSCMSTSFNQGSLITVSPDSTTTYFVKADGFCNTTPCVNFKVSVNSLPKVNAGKDTFVCLGASVGLKPTPLPGINTYNWTPSIGLDNPNVLNPKASPATVSFYTLKITDANNCSNTDSLKVSVNQLPSAKISNSGPLTFCQNDSVILKAIAGLFYKWKNSGSNIILGTLVNYTAKLSGNYYVEVTNAAGCKDSSNEINIKVNLLPNVSLNSNGSTTFCEGNSVILEAFKDSKSSYIWLRNNSILDGISSNSYNVTSAGKYKVLIKNIYSCLDSSKEINVVVNLLPKVEAGSDSSFCLGSIIHLNGKITNGKLPYTYTWSPSTYLDSNKILKPKANLNKLDTIIYRFSVQDFNGCKNKDSVLVNVIDKPHPIFTKWKDYVCKNEYWVEYCVAPTTNNFKWSVDSGTILLGQFTNCIKVHWMDKDTIGNIYLTEKLKTNSSCSDKIVLRVNLKKGNAQDTATVVAKANNIYTNILICNFCSYKNLRWGFEDKNFGNEIEIKKYKNKTYCIYDAIDTFRNNYWVKVGDDDSCLTKSYFKNPRIVNSVSSLLNNTISLYPNPSYGKITVESTTYFELLDIYNLFGEKINAEVMEEQNHEYVLNLYSLAKGIYFISIKTKEGIILKKIVKY